MSVPVTGYKKSRKRNLALEQRQPERDGQHRIARPKKEKGAEAIREKCRSSVGLETWNRIHGCHSRRGNVLVSISHFHLAIEYLGVRRPLDLPDADQAPFGARERVIHQDVVPWHMQLEFHDGGPARGNGYGLHAPRRRT